MKWIESLCIGPDVQFRSCGTTAKEAIIVPLRSYGLPKQRFLKGVACFIEYSVKLMLVNADWPTNATRAG
jgi:hypothetical protein